VQRAVDWSQRDRLPLAMHVAESPEELTLVEQGQGPFRELLERWELWDAPLFPWTDGIDGLLRQLASAHRALVVHGNYLTASQIAFLATQPQISVVYCPRTHAYFGHPRHPVAELQRAGVRVALGTDSTKYRSPERAIQSPQTLVSPFQCFGGSVFR
jgi:cytosine/adenosine deaminase-related metal-dependent hydrolase